MTTIAYDRPVKDLIAQLDATGHVSHRSYTKTSVTLHHNAGRLSHEGVLEVWKTRPASAHFDVDGSGAVAQYVRTAEYAWAVGNTEGNQRTISIEMANATLGPDWTVADATWKGAARLAGWLFAKVIGERPSPSNLFQHNHWSSTGCPGPFVAKIWNQILAEAQASYDYFHKAAPTPAPHPTPAPTPVPVRKSNTQIAAEVWAGKWGSGPDRAKRLKAAGYDPNLIQDLVNKGVGKPGGSAPTPPARKSNAEIAAEVIAGKWGVGDDRRRRLAAAGYNATTIQTEVNRQLAGHSSGKSIAQLAAEVIAGQWGNGPDRARRLAAAGYDAAAVQAEVNRRV